LGYKGSIKIVGGSPAAADFSCFVCLKVLNIDESLCLEVFSWVSSSKAVLVREKTVQMRKEAIQAKEKAVQMREEAIREREEAVKAWEDAVQA
jgi:hypothetical protein